MKIFLYLAIFGICFTLVGCASNPDIDRLSSQQRGKMYTMKLIQGAASSPHTILGQVKG